MLLGLRRGQSLLLTILSRDKGGEYGCGANVQVDVFTKGSVVLSESICPRRAAIYLLTGFPQGLQFVGLPTHPRENLVVF